MNIKRGLFRLWLLFTAIFISCALIISFDEIKMQFQKSKNIDNSDHAWEIMLPVACNHARGKLKVDYVDNLEGEFCWYSIDKFRQFYTEYKDMSNYELTTKLYNEADTALQVAKQNKRSLNRLIHVFTLALGIPLLVLLFGYSLLWVCSGFRKK